MEDNYHGWFVRIGRGIYDLSQAGREKVIDLGAQKE